MKLRKSKLLQRLREGKSSCCLKINLSDPRIIEISGLCGMDAVWLCQEHVPNDWLNLENQIRAAKLYDVDTIVRVGSGGYSDYIKPFEADATGIMVPHVNTADQARQIVNQTRYFPLGMRALDGGNADGQFALAPMEEYIQNCNCERFIIFQIESPEAVENVEEIAAVEGFDILLFGPGDYSHHLGKPGEINSPDVKQAKKRVVEAAKKYNKFAMVTAPTQSFEELLKEGYRIFNIGSDVVGMAQHIRKLRNEFDLATQSFRPSS